MDNNKIVLNEEDVPGAKLMKAPNDCCVEELKRWLECHGLKRTGKKRTCGTSLFKRRNH